MPALLHRCPVLRFKRATLRSSRTRGSTPRPAHRKRLRPGASPLVSGARHVLYRDTSFGSGALHLGEIYPQLLRLLLGRLRGVGLFLAPACGFLSLLGRSLRGVLDLLGGATGGVLGLSRSLPRGILHLARSFAGGVLHSLRRLPGLPEHSPDGVRGLTSGLAHGVLGSSAFLAS